MGGQWGIKEEGTADLGRERKGLPRLRKKVCCFENKSYEASENGDLILSTSKATLWMDQARIDPLLIADASRVQSPARYTPIIIKSIW